MVAAEQGVLLAQGEGHVVRGVTRREERLDRPAVAFDDLAPGQDLVRMEGVVLVLLQRPRGVGDRKRRAGGQDRRAGLLCERAGEGGMVAVGVGHQHMADPAALDGGDQGLEVGGVGRAGIDDGDAGARRVAPDDIGSGAGEGERPRIVRDHPLDQRRNRIAPAPGEIELTNEGDHPRPPARGRGPTGG